MTVKDIIDLARQNFVNLKLGDNSDASNNALYGFMKLGMMELARDTRDWIDGETFTMVEGQNLYTFTGHPIIVAGAFNTTTGAELLEGSVQSNGYILPSPNTIFFNSVTAGDVIQVNYFTYEKLEGNYASTTSVAQVETVELNVVTQGHQYYIGFDTSVYSKIWSFTYPITFPLEPPPTWISAWTYVTNTRVAYNGNYYIALTDHNGVATTPDADATNWAKYNPYRHRILAELYKKIKDDADYSNLGVTVTSDAIGDLDGAVDANTWHLASVDNTITTITFTASTAGEPFSINVDGLLTETISTANVTGTSQQNTEVNINPALVNALHYFMLHKAILTYKDQSGLIQTNDYRSKYKQAVQDYINSRPDRNFNVIQADLIKTKGYI